MTATDVVVVRPQKEPPTSQLRERVKCGRAWRSRYCAYRRYADRVQGVCRLFPLDHHDVRALAKLVDPVERQVRQWHAAEPRTAVWPFPPKTLGTVWLIPSHVDRDEGAG